MNLREEMTRHAESVDNNSLYTQPEDILKIYNRLSNISPYFSIAAGFGNVHGVYVCFGGSSTYLTDCSIIRNPATSSFIQSCSPSTKSTSLKKLAPQIWYVECPFKRLCLWLSIPSYAICGSYRSGSSLLSLCHRIERISFASLYPF